jgi:hypothetical protein
MTLKDSDILNLPEAPDFIQTPPQYTMEEMFMICEKMLPYWNKLRLENPPPPFVGEPFRLLEEDLKE